MLRRSLWIGASSVVVALGLLALSAGGASAAEKGYLGVYLKPAADAGGAIVAEIVAGSPAEKAGLKAGDRIVSVSGITVKEPADLVQVVQAASVGDKLQLAAKRGEEPVLIEVTLAAPPAGSPAPAPTDKPAPEPKAERGFLGVGFAEVDPAVAAHLGLADAVGVSVGDVWKDSPAAKAGIAEHDIILAVDGKDVKGPGAFVEILGAKKPGETVKIDFLHKGEKKSLEVALDKRPANLPQREAFAGRPFPEHGRRGRLLFEGPGGKHVFELPEGSWDFDTFRKHMEGLMGPGDGQERLQKLFDALREGDSGQGWSSSSHTSSVVKVVEGGLDITIRDEDGVRTVDVKKGDEVVAEKLPWDQLKTLPEDVRQAVEKAGENIKVHMEKKLLPLEPSSSGEKELRA